MSTEFIDSNIRGNRVQSALLIFAMVCMLALIGLFLGGLVGAGIAIGLCLIAIVFGPAVTPQIILRMYKAEPIPRQSSPQLYDLFAELVRRAELPIAPTLYYIPSRTLNAFAVGSQSNSAVAITDGLLRMLDARRSGRRAGSRTQSHSASRHVGFGNRGHRIENHRHAFANWPADVVSSYSNFPGQRRLHLLDRCAGIGWFANNQQSAAAGIVAFT